jgi:hypothetical protein
MKPSLKATPSPFPAAVIATVKPCIADEAKPILNVSKKTSPGFSLINTLEKPTMIEVAAVAP